jgi:hypothetical protein
MAESATRRIRGKKARGKHRSKEDEIASYLVQIEEWEWGFSFGIGNRRFNDGPYMDFRHLHLRGKLIAPSRIKTETVEVILMPNSLQTNERYDIAEPSSVGSVSVSRGRFEALLTMPCDALVPFLQQARLPVHQSQQRRLDGADQVDGGCNLSY